MRENEDATGSDRALTLQPDRFLESLAEPGTKNAAARIPLPGGKFAIGTVTHIHHGDGTMAISGTITQPYPGTFYFLRQPLPNKSGPLVGNILFDDRDLAYRVYPSGTGQTPELREVTADDVICRNNSAPERTELTESPSSQPAAAQAPVPALESLPGAKAVVYLDFDGESGTFSRWPNQGNEQPINAEPSGMSDAQMRETWARVAEDYRPFNINITTIRSVYTAAPITSRMHCIVTPTDTAARGAGGVAYLDSFNWNDTRKVCWGFVTSSGKNCAEAVSHEVGHTLNLSHDGTASKSYYDGHGTDPVGWAPIMGVGYYKNITQWSKGEYAGANNKQDDLAIIVKSNNVSYRADAAGSAYATAVALQIAPDGSVDGTHAGNQGIIETTGDVDALKFTTRTPGNLSLLISPAAQGVNLDILAELVREDGSVVATSGPNDAGDNSPSATLQVPNLAAGNYFIRVTGSGRGSATGTGYSNYGSLGSYSVSGGIEGVVMRIPQNVGILLDSLFTPPGNGPFTYAWSTVGGPGTATFATPAAKGSAVNFTTAGIYKLRLTISNGGSTWTDDFNVHYGASAGTGNPNIGPVVDAGPDQIVSVNTTTLAATLSDDGKPVASPTGGWLQVSGPGTITFGNAVATNSTATASAPGTYQLRWTGNDTAVKTFDDVLVTFNFGASTPYESWKIQKFAANASNQTIAGDTADPDMDGHSNLLEYALDTNPNAADAAGVDHDLETISSNKHLRLSITKNPSATDLTFAIEVTSDVNGAWSNDVTVESNTSTRLIARDNTPVSAAQRRFIRLKVTKNP